LELGSKHWEPDNNIGSNPVWESIELEYFGLVNGRTVQNVYDALTEGLEKEEIREVENDLDFENGDWDVDWNRVTYEDNSRGWFAVVDKADFVAALKEERHGKEELEKLEKEASEIEVEQEEEDLRKSLRKLAKGSITVQEFEDFISREVEKLKNTVHDKEWAHHYCHPFEEDEPSYGSLPHILDEENMEIVRELGGLVTEKEIIDHLWKATEMVLGRPGVEPDNSIGSMPLLTDEYLGNFKEFKEAKKHLTPSEIKNSIKDPNAHWFSSNALEYNDPSKSWYAVVVPQKLRERLELEKTNLKKIEELEKEALEVEVEEEEEGLRKSLRKLAKG
jgi:hypothetical protein